MIKPLFSLSNGVVEYRHRNERPNFFHLRPAKTRLVSASQPSFALNDVSLSICEGDRIGVIGLNGAGKSTLLKVVSGVLPPTSGTVTRNSKVTSLLNSSLGMDLNLSGRDNLVIRSMLLGFSKPDAINRVEFFAEWTELGSKINEPISTYSDGMRARLAFVINTQVSEGILVIDEGIGAGDASFQGKAQLRLKQFFNHSNAIIIASHSLEFLHEFCSKYILMHEGKILLEGTYKNVVDQYEEIVSKKLVGYSNEKN